MILDFFRITPKSRKVRLLNNRNGVLFSNPGGVKKMVFYFSNLLFIASVCFAIYLYYPIANAYFNYWQVTRPVATNVAGIIPTPTLVPVPIEENVEPGYFISIPKILAKAQVIDNVSPFNSAEYLKVLNNDTVAKAKGTAEPGDGKGKSTYIFAHSSGTGLASVRNNAVFYLLGELKSGDEIIVTKDRKKYQYRVYNQLVISANQIEYLKYSDPGKEVLILQTCWPIGTDWKRLLIFAELVSI